MHPSFGDAGLREIHRALIGADSDGRVDLRAFAEEAGDFTLQLEEWHGPTWPSLVEATAGMWLDYPGLHRHQVESITEPVLVLAADQDEIVGLDLAVDLFGTLPDAELAVVPGADHEAPSSDHHAPIFATLMADFIARRVPHTR